MDIVALRTRLDVLRMPNEVAALLLALQVRNPDLSQLAGLSDEEWRRLLAFCNIAHLTLPLARLASREFPKWVVDQLQTNLSDNALRFERVKETYREAAAALDRAGVEHLVIKGFTQAPDYVGDPHLRFQSDIDVVCPSEQIKSAQQALVAIGYKFDEKENSPDADHIPALVRLNEWEWKGNPFDPEMPLGIELHFCLWNERVSRIPITEAELFWERRTTRTLNDLSFPCLHQVDHLGHLALHVLRNIFFRDWIAHHVYEVSTFLNARASDDDFWQSWTELHSPSLRSFEAIAFYYAHTWFNCDLHPLIEREIESMPDARLSWLHRFSDSGLEVMFRENKDSVWLQLSLIPSLGDRWAILKKMMIPSRIAPMNSPRVRVRNKRLVGSSNSYPWRQYLAYLASRSASHGHASLTTLRRGLSWRLSQHSLPTQFWAFLTAFFFFNSGLAIYFFLFNLFLLGYGYTEKNLGLFTSAMAVGNLVGALPSGKLASRFGLRPVLLGCFLFATLFCAARALLLSFAAQLVLAFLVGIALSAWAVCLTLVVTQVTNEKQRPFAFSLIFSLGIGLGVLGGLAGGKLPGWFTHHLHVDKLVPAQVVLLIACGIVALGILPLTRLTLGRPQISPRARPLISSPLLRFLPAIAVWSFVTGSFAPLASVFLAKQAHLSLPQIGNAFSLSQVVQVVAVLAAPLLFRRMGLVGGIVASQIAASLLLLTLAAINHPLAAIAAYVGFSAFQWMNEPGLYSLLMNIVPPCDRSGAAASNSLTISASQAIAATLAGIAFTRYGYPAVLRGIALLALLAATLFWNLQERPERNRSPVFDDVTS
jgi:predicted MFS family arabinose efflux permease